MKKPFFFSWAPANTKEMRKDIINLLFFNICCYDAKYMYNAL